MKLRLLSCVLLFWTLFPLALHAQSGAALFSERVWSGAELNEACREVGFSASTKVEDAMLVGVCLGEVEVSELGGTKVRQ